MAIGEDGSWINREEFTPYGETSFGSFAYKRYRFTGKQRDEESGLNYHGARYLAPWLGKWLSCDPKGIISGLNAYTYVRNNPVLYTDSTGLEVDLDVAAGGGSNQTEQDQYAAHLQEDVEATLGIRTTYDSATGIIQIGDQNQDQQIDDADTQAALDRIEQLRVEFQAADRCGNDARCNTEAIRLATEFIESLLPAGHPQSRRLEVNVANRSPIGTHGRITYGEADPRVRSDTDRTAVVAVDPRDYDQGTRYVPQTPAGQAFLANPNVHRVMGPFLLLLHEKEHNTVRATEDSAIRSVNYLQQALGLPERVGYLVHQIQGGGSRVWFEGGRVIHPFHPSLN